MVDVRLVNYIQASLSRKIPVNQIKTALKSRGWRDADINDAINAATQKTIPQKTMQKTSGVAQQPTKQISKSSPQKKPPLKFPKQPIKNQAPLNLPRTFQKSPVKKAPLKFSAQKISPKFPRQPVHKFAPQQFPTQKPKKKEFHLPKNLLIISIGAILTLIIIIVILFLVLRGSSSISDEELSKGVSVDLKQNKDIKFNIDEEEHKITANSILENSVSLTILSTTITITLEIGDIKKIDFEHDGTYDLSIKLNSIENGKANILVKRISEKCVEDWDCTDWTECVNEQQTRECTDLNDCGSDDDKPDEIQECEVIFTCDELGGILCNLTQICNGTIENSSDGDCCVGECIENQTEGNETETEIGAIDCGTDMDCFIENAENCTPSNLIFESDSSNSTWTQLDTFYFEIKGYEGDECGVDAELTDSSGSFTEAGRTALNETGKNETEIDEIEQDINDELESATGNTGTCDYPTSDLVDVLETMDSNGYFELSSEEITEYGCTGDLF